MHQLNRFASQLKLGLGAVALTSLTAFVPAHAVVVNFTTPLAVPATGDGLYINFATGATGSTSSAVPGWDFNPYLATGSLLSFFWNTAVIGPAAGVATATAGGQYIDLSLGTQVSSASTFTAITATTATVQFRPVGAHTLGFRFYNEGTASTNYGYLTFVCNSVNGLPATITGWSFENSGGAITVVPEPSTGLLLGMGALALGALKLRRRG